jgi:hypothetical protein
MTLILTKEEIESIFTLDECFAALEPAVVHITTVRPSEMSYRSASAQRA